MKLSIRYRMTPLTREDILELKTYLRGVHPPDKICADCKSWCGPRLYDGGHDRLCDACASKPVVGAEDEP